MFTGIQWLYTTARVYGGGQCITWISAIFKHVCSQQLVLLSQNCWPGDGVTYVAALSTLMLVWYTCHMILA